MDGWHQLANGSSEAQLWACSCWNCQLLMAYSTLLTISVFGVWSLIDLGLLCGNALCKQKLGGFSQLLIPFLTFLDEVEALGTKQSFSTSFLVEVGMACHAHVVSGSSLKSTWILHDFLCCRNPLLEGTSIQDKKTNLWFYETIVMYWNIFFEWLSDAEESSFSDPQCASGTPS